MTLKLQFYYRVLRHLLAGNVVSPEIIRNDYDRLSSTYDDYFSRRMGVHSRRMIAEMGLQPGMRVLDLACGTGTLTLAIAEAIGGSGEVIGVDGSSGMLLAAARKAKDHGFEQVQFLQSDIEQAAGSFNDSSFDAVTCGWAIGYARPQLLIDTIASKLRAGGKLGIIENARDTLAPIRKAAIRVAQTLPGHFSRIMDLHMRLPRNTADLESLFRHSGLAPVNVWEGEEVFEFAGGREALDWVLHTGASAGFDRMMDESVRRQCDELFVRYIEDDALRGGKIRVAHRFVAGIAGKER